MSGAWNSPQAEESPTAWLDEELQRREQHRRHPGEHQDDVPAPPPQQEQPHSEQRPAPPASSSQHGGPARSLSPEAAAAGAVGRHAWAVDEARWAGPWPVLLLEWRQDATGAWWGRCLLAGAYSAQGLTVTDTWISARHLQPADSPAPQTSPHAG